MYGFSDKEAPKYKVEQPSFGNNSKFRTSVPEGYKDSAIARQAKCYIKVSPLSLITTIIGRERRGV